LLDTQAAANLCRNYHSALRSHVYEVCVSFTDC
jgi:hypothetical protein